MIAAGDHPVPIDLETILQATAEEHKAQDPEGAGLRRRHGHHRQFGDDGRLAARLWPLRRQQCLCHGRHDRGLGCENRHHVEQHQLRRDAAGESEGSPAATNPNLPHVDGRYAKFGDHIDDFVSGFADYAKFLLRWHATQGRDALFDGFAGLPVRKVIRPTRFYYMLLQRLKNHRTMDDGAVWSAQADFVARLSEWDKDFDPLWPLQRAERAALAGIERAAFRMRRATATRSATRTAVSVRTDGDFGHGSRAGARCRTSMSGRSPGRSR